MSKALVTEPFMEMRSRLSGVRRPHIKQALSGLPDVIITYLISVIQTLAGPLPVDPSLKRLAVMAKTLCRVSLAILFIKLAELFDANPVAVLVSVMVILHSDEIRLLRRIEMFMNKAMCLLMGCFASFLGNMLSCRRQSRGWRFFLLLMTFAAGIQESAAALSQADLVDFVRQEPPYSPGTRPQGPGLSTGGIVLIVVAALLVPFIVWSALLGPCSPFSLRNYRKRGTAVQTAGAMEANESPAPVEGYSLVDGPYRLRSMLANPGADGIALPPRALNHQTWRFGRPSFDSLRDAASTETAVASNSSLSLQGRSQGSPSIHGTQDEDTLDPPARTVPVESEQEVDVLSIGSVFQDIDVTAVSDELDLGANVLEVEEHTMSSITTDNAPNVNDLGSDTFGPHMALAPEDLDEIYRLVALRTRTDALFMSTTTGGTSLSGSTAAGSDELEDVASGAALLPARHTQTAGTADPDLALENTNEMMRENLPFDTPELAISSSLLFDAGAHDGDGPSNAVEIADATNPTVAARSASLEILDRAVVRGASLVKSNTI